MKPRNYRATPLYYDAENERHEMLRQDVPFFLDQLPRRKRLKILELACGTARAAIPLAQAGHRVVGIDFDEEMLKIAIQKRDSVGLKPAELSIVRGDMLKLSLGERFDWVCIFFNTLLAFTTLAEQDKVVAGIAAHMKPGGHLWLDFFNPDFSLLAEAKVTDLTPYVFHVPELDRTVMMTTDVRQSRRPQVQEITFRYAWFDSAGMQRHEQRRFEITYMQARELQILLERHGLTVERIFGDYDGSELSRVSPRIIARCCRKR